ncbi:hypothetical protein [Haloferula sargassicola]|uniref:Fibronectin type-III domain-containing protein n=1 Tax=Haloferula sargassicola TaxID=490096 RepID=A0ABP9UJE4_9BACT
MKHYLALPGILACLAPAAQAVVVSANIVGGAGANGTLGSVEVAGVVAVANWNNIPNTGNDITVNDLNDSTGAPTTIDISWTSIGAWSINTGAGGDFALYNGYLDNFDQTRTVTFSGLDAGTTYEIYVYADGDNGTNTRRGHYTMGGTTTTIIDGPGNFAGTFVEVPAGGDAEGNYTVFTVSGSTSYDLTFNGDNTDDLPRAAINGFQIVSVPEPGVAMLGLLGLIPLRRRRSH